MTNEDLNLRCAFFAEHGLPYCEKVWFLLARAWNEGYDQCKADEASFQAGEEQVRANPFRGTPTRTNARSPIAYGKPEPKR